MEQKQSLWQKVFPFLCIIFGNIIYALTIKLFVLPSGIALGGTTGIALIIENFFGIPISAFVLVFNIVMLCVGYFILGNAFAMTTILSSFCYPVFLEISNRIFGDYYITDDVFLCSVLGGVGLGFALGLVIRSGASTGGMDIPPLVLNKLMKIPVSVSLYVFDVCILMSQALFTDVEKILYGIVLVCLYTMVIDKLMLMGSSQTEIKIISEKHDEIRQAII